MLHLSYHLEFIAHVSSNNNNNTNKLFVKRTSNNTTNICTIRRCLTTTKITTTSPLKSGLQHKHLPETEQNEHLQEI